MRKQLGVQGDGLTLLYLRLAVLGPIVEHGLLKSVGLEDKVLKRSSQTSGRDKCELFGKGELSLIAEV